MSGATGFWEKSDLPQSPRTKWDSQAVYCWYPVRSRPSWCFKRAMSAEVIRGLIARAFVGSCVRWMARKTRMLEMSRTGIEKSSRRTMYRNTVSSPFTRSQLWSWGSV